jgi:hypothetical protein
MPLPTTAMSRLPLRTTARSAAFVLSLAAIVSVKPFPFTRRPTSIYGTPSPLDQPGRNPIAAANRTKRKWMRVVHVSTESAH